MKTNRSTRSSQTGGILVLVMTMLVAFSLLTAALLQLGRYSAQEAELQFNKSQAFWLAEMGLERVKAEINTTNGWAKIKNSALNSTWTTNFNVPNAGSCSVVMTNKGASEKNFVITSTGRARNGAVQTNQIDASLKGFGDRLWTTHSENGLYFLGGDNFANPGEFYTDDNIWIGKDDGKGGATYPVFNDLVQVAGDVTNSVGKKKKKSLILTPEVIDTVFQGGLKTGVPELDWTSVYADFADLPSQSFTTNLTPTGNYTLKFQNTNVIAQQADSKGDPLKFRLTVTNVTYDKKGKPIEEVVTTDKVVDPFSITINGQVLYLTGDAYVKGDIGGQLAIATTQSIYITDDIIYTSAASKDKDPSKWGSWLPNANETLGLYAGEKVQIDKKGDGDVKIHAGILVLSTNVPNRERHKKGKKYSPDFSEIGFCDSEENKKDKKGNVYLYGSIAQYLRGELSKQEEKPDGKKDQTNGHDKNFQYDSRFSDDPPPGMPLGSVFTFSNWKQL